MIQDVGSRPARIIHSRQNRAIRGNTRTTKIGRKVDVVKSVTYSDGSLRNAGTMVLDSDNNAGPGDSLCEDTVFPKASLFSRVRILNQQFKKPSIHERQPDSLYGTCAAGRLLS